VIAIRSVYQTTGKKSKLDWLARIHFGVTTCASGIAAESFLYISQLPINIHLYRWNAALALASFLDSNPDLYMDRNVLELGAGGGLPSIVASKNGARKVSS
jgi:hypothetical protein